MEPEGISLINVSTIYDPVLATYNSEDKCNASMEVIQVVLYMGAHEVSQ